jgi:hypothetical protein
MLAQVGPHKVSVQCEQIENYIRISRKREELPKRNKANIFHRKLIIERQWKISTKL